jgi:hypothetical protein
MTIFNLNQKSRDSGMHSSTLLFRVQENEDLWSLTTSHAILQTYLYMHIYMYIHICAYKDIIYICIVPFSPFLIEDATSQFQA